jgi:hypothetical protein
MKVFQNLDREQAAMYRWIRDTCDASTFAALTGQSGWIKMDAMQIDTAFREAYHVHSILDAGARATNAAKLSAGILPTSLGAALARYTEAVEACATFAESFAGPTFSDVNNALENALMDLTDEMRKLQA